MTPWIAASRQPAVTTNYVELFADVLEQAAVQAAKWRDDLHCRVLAVTVGELVL